MTLNKESCSKREHRVMIKKRDQSAARKAKLFETKIFEIEASGPFCVLPPYFFERSLDLANNTPSEASGRQAGIVFEDLRNPLRQ